MSKTTKSLLTFLLILLAATFVFAPAQAQGDSDQPVVRAVLFYSPTCPHCEKVIQQVLPPLLEQYGEQLRIVAINTSTVQGNDLFQTAIDQFNIEKERQGVPFLVIEDTVLVGEREIPEQFPGLIEEALASGGTDWPDIPGLAEVVATVHFSAGPTGRAIQENPAPPSMKERFMLDPVGNTVSVLTLIGMIIAVGWVIYSFTRPLPEKDFWPNWVIPVLSVLGIGVAFYLTYVETSGTEAICGPVGDCNTVQASPYATLFGVLPVGLLGIIGYALILGAWAIYTWGDTKWQWITAVSIWGMSFFGVLFSIYLTFLEPFVIGATCMWCISSAIFQTVILLAATPPAKRAWQEDDFGEEDDEDEEEPEEEEPPQIEAESPTPEETDEPASGEEPSNE